MLKTSLKYRAALLGSVSNGPTWFSDFTKASLPSGVSVSSPSLGGLVTDASGKLTYKPNNLLTYSNSFSNAAWTAANVTVTAGVSDPFGGTVASTIAATAAGGNIYQYTGTSTGINVVTSVWMRRRTGTGNIYLYGADFSVINVTSAVSSTWTQVYRTTTTGTYGRAYGGIALAVSGDAVDVYAFTSSAVTYETTPRPGDQVITTSSVYYGPVFDYDPVTLKPLGLRIWEQRQNLWIQSQTLSNAAYSKTFALVTDAATTAPDGTLTAGKLYSDTSNNYHALFRNVTFTSSPYTMSLYVKPAGVTSFSVGTGNTTTWNAVATYDLVNGTVAITAGTASITSVGNGWWRLTLTATASVASANINLVLGAAGPYVGDGSSGVYVWGVQLEAASVAGPYIPTSSAAVTAAADVVALTGTPLGVLQGASGAFVMDVGSISVSNGNYLETYTGGTAYISAYGKTSPNYYLSGAVVSQTGMPTANFRIGMAWGGGTFSGTANGATPVNGSGSNGVPANALLGNGRGGTTNMNGYIRKLAIYSSRLPDATLKAKTVQGAAF